MTAYSDAVSVVMTATRYCKLVYIYTHGGVDLVTLGIVPIYLYAYLLAHFVWWNSRVSIVLLMLCSLLC